MTEKKGSYITRRFHDPLDDILDRPIAFNPAFKKITGSTVAALMLSQGWYWSKRTSDEDGWFYKTGVEWEEETGLSRSEQETARKILRNAGVWEEDLRGVPATMYYRINRQEIYSKLGVQFAGIPQTSFGDSGNQDGEIPANIKRNSEITTETTQSGADAPESVEWQIGMGQKVITVPDNDAAQRRDAANLIATGLGIHAKAAAELAFAFQDERGMTFTNSEVKGQRKAVKFLLEKKVQPEHVREAVRTLMGKNFTCANLFSITDNAVDLANQKPVPPVPTRVIHRATPTEGINMAEAKRRGLIPG